MDKDSESEDQPSRYDKFLEKLKNAKQSSELLEFSYLQSHEDPAAYNHKARFHKVSGRVKDFYLYPRANQDCDRSDCGNCGHLPIEIHFVPDPENEMPSVTLLFSLEYHHFFYYLHNKYQYVNVKFPSLEEEED